MVLHVLEIPPKVTKIVTLSGGRGLGKTTLSLSKDVTIRWGRGSKARGTMPLYMTFFIPSLSQLWILCPCRKE